MTRENKDKPSLSRMIEDAVQPVVESERTPARDVVCTSNRIPRAVLDEVAAVARSNGISISLLINLLLDAHLRGEGRPGYAELAPWYPDYVLRRSRGT